MKARNLVHTALVAGFALGVSTFSVAAAEVPAPGVSPTIDSIRSSGSLRAGLLTNPPWLIENTSGSGEQWQGPAWELTKRAAEELGVEIVNVPVSHETKIPALAADQIDIAVTPLAVNEERLRVIDFVTYSVSSQCMYGLASNPKFADAQTVDDLNSPDVTIAYLIGAPEEAWTKSRFPAADLKGVVSSSPTPIEEIMSGRSDAAPVNRIQWNRLSSSVEGLIALPRENNCQDSLEQAADIGMGLDKGDDAFRDWLQTLADEMDGELREIEQQIIRDYL